MSQTENMKSGSSLIKALFRITLSGSLLLYLAKQVDVGAVWSILSRAHLGYFAAAVAAMLLLRCHSAYRWQVLLACGNAKSNYSDLLKITFASSFYGLFLPGGSNELLRVVAQSRKSSDLAFAFSSVALDRLLGIFTLAATTLIALRFVEAPVGPGIPIWASAIALAAAAIYAAGQSRVLRRLFDALLALKWLAKPRDKWRKLLVCFDAMQRKYLAMAWALALAFVLQGLRVVGALLLGRALGLDLEGSYYFAFVPMIYFVQLLPISIGGFGTREASFVYLFAFAGVASETALALSLLLYVATLVSSLPGAWIGHTAFSKDPPTPSTADAETPVR